VASIYGTGGGGEGSQKEGRGEGGREEGGTSSCLRSVVSISSPFSFFSMACINPSTLTYGRDQTDTGERGGGGHTDCKESTLCSTRSLTSSRARAKQLNSSFFALSSVARNSSGTSVLASLHSCAFCSLHSGSGEGGRGGGMLHSLAILLLEISSLSFHSRLDAFDHSILSLLVLVALPSFASSCRLILGISLRIC
jgi:hypothetical protein